MYFKLIKEMKEINELSTEELLIYKVEVDKQIKENLDAYNKRFSDNPSVYSASINDEYNGDNADNIELIRVRSEIEGEIRKRDMNK